MQAMEIRLAMLLQFKCSQRLVAASRYTLDGVAWFGRLSGGKTGPYPNSSDSFIGRIRRRSSSLLVMAVVPDVVVQMLGIHRDLHHIHLVPVQIHHEQPIRSPSG
jgi:hypothetical protein